MAKPWNCICAYHGLSCKLIHDGSCDRKSPTGECNAKCQLVLFILILINLNRNYFFYSACFSSCLRITNVCYMNRWSDMKLGSNKKKEKGNIIWSENKKNKNQYNDEWIQWTHTHRCAANLFPKTEWVKMSCNLSISETESFCMFVCVWDKVWCIRLAHR